MADRGKGMKYNQIGSDQSDWMIHTWDTYQLDWNDLANHQINSISRKTKISKTNELRETNEHPGKNVASLFFRPVEWSIDNQLELCLLIKRSENYLRGKNIDRIFIQSFR